LKKIKKKIIVRLAGGLGNQLFQFFAAIKLAEKLDLKFDAIHLETKYLASYSSKRSFAIAFMVNLYEGVKVDYDIPLLARFFVKFRFAKLFNRKFFYYALISDIKNIDSIKTDYENAKIFVLDGYFQCPGSVISRKEMSKVRDKLFSKKRYLKDKYFTNDKLPSLALHIRRGDYISSKSASKYFVNLDLDYYIESLNKIKNPKTIYIFSDDAKASEYFAQNFSGIDVSELKLSLEDEFVLMALCDDYIIANSTFSWWASYIGYFENNKVISPMNWFLDHKSNKNNSLLLESFLKINNKT